MTTDAPYPRQLHRRVTAALADTPVVLVNGPRQSGKTTLVRQVAAATGRRYLTLDDQGTLEAARADPQGFVRHLDTAVIDEVQRVPALLLALKWTVDQDRRPGRFLITGSADVMSLPGVADSLAGRIEVLTLWPLAGAELCGSPGGWLDAVFAALAADAVPPVVDQQQARGEVGAALATRVLAGGYPEAVRRAPARRAAWARNYLDRIMQRDVRDIAEVDRLDAMPRLVQALAQVAGQPCNYTQLGGQLGLDAKTVSRYLALLEQLYLVRRVLPWTAIALSRLLKTPKLQFLDAGLLASLLRLDHARVARDRATFGRVLECHVYGELRRMASWTDDPVEVMTYRDKEQREVDFVLENGQGEAIGVEVKAAASVTLADAAGLRTLTGKAGPRFLGGVVLYDGVDTLPLGTATGRPLWAMPLSSLWLT